METTSGADGSLFTTPAGGGLRPLGDSFQPDLLRGTGNYAVALEAPAGAGGIRPSLGLRYSTGQGNGPYGMGWQLTGVLSIARGTDGGVPRYDDGDTLVLGGDELVDVGGGRWRPRSDTQGWDVRRHGEGWRIRTKDGRAFVLGDTAGSRVEADGRVFAWSCSSETDAAGNEITYTYRRDGGQLYLEAVSWSIFSFHLHHTERPDPCTTTRPGFSVTTALRCDRIERRCSRATPPLVGAYSLDYAESAGAALSLLTGVRYDGVAADGTLDPQPPLSFAYSDFDLEPRLVTVGSDDSLLPFGVPDAALVDLDGDGLPDVLQTGATGHRWWRNRGGGRFEAARRLGDAPAGLRLGSPGVSFADLTGDGSADLIGIGTRLQRVARNLGDGRWGDEPGMLAGQVALAVSASDSRFVDLDGDGVTDLLQAGPRGLTMYYGTGDASWSPPEFVSRRSGDDFPDVRLDDLGIFVADFAGDGMRTIGEIRSGLVRYWPHLGRGRFAPVVEMTRPPTFPTLFRERNLFLADLDGDGTTDLLYVDGDRLLIWLNRSGRAWSAPIEVPFAPSPDATSLELVDLLGVGTPGLLWRRPGSAAPRFFDLGVAVKPYLLGLVQNGCGASTEIAYASTSTMRQDATSAAGVDEWGTYLPFPLHVVARLVDRDATTGASAETHFTYERGYFDPADRIFRGFEAVEARQVGDEASPTTVQRTVFHIGAPNGDGKADRDTTARSRLHALAGATVAVELSTVDPDGSRRTVNRMQLAWAARDEFADAEGVRVCFPHLVSATSTDVAGPGGRDRVEQTEYTYDGFGNVVAKRRTLRFDGDATATRTDQRIEYAVDEPGWRVGLPARLTTRDDAGRLLGDERVRYDGAPFEGLAEGQVGRGLVTRRLELVLVGADLPPAYEDHIGPDWGLTKVGDDWYRAAEAVARDAAGNIVGQDEPGGGRTTIEYDADGVFPLRSIDALGRVTTARFDPRTAQPAELVTPEGLRTRYEHGASGRLVAQFDTTADGSEALTSYVAWRLYDPAQPAAPAHCVSVLPSEPGRTLDELAAADLTTLDAASVELTYLDGRGQTIQRAAPAASEGGGWIIGGRSRRTRSGAPAEEVPNDIAASPAFQPGLPGGAAVRYTYDALGRVVLIRHPDGGRFRVEYLGDRLRKWDAETPDDAEPTVEHYDAIGSLVAVDTPLDGATVTTSYEVDHAGRIVTVTDAEGTTPMRYRFAGPGPAVSISDTAAGERTYWRDAAGRVRRRSDATGRVITTSYDAAGRQTAVADATDPAHPRTIRRSVYTGARLDRQVEDGLETRFAYDAVGHPVEKTVVFGPGDELTIRREFGLRGEVRATVYPDGERVEHDHHADGSLRALSGVVRSVEYDAHGLPTEIDFGAVAATYTHTRDLKRLTGVALRRGAELLRGQEYTYDRNGCIVAVVDTVGGGPPEVTAHRYRYDPLLRLVEWRTTTGGPDGPEAARVAYRYDRRGDLLESGETGVTTFRRDGPDGRAVTSVERAGGSTFAVPRDALGRAQEVGGARDVRYDAWDRIVQMTLPDASVVRFEYDAADQRLRRTLTKPDGTSEVTRWIDGVYEVGPSGTRSSYAVGSLVVATRTVDPAGAEARRCLLTDQLGSVICTVDVFGAAATQQSFTPFGIGLRPGVDAQYAGAFDADGGMLQLGARWYHPLLGRFVTPDWYVLENPEVARRLPQAFNLYSYAINNPIMLRDPSGRFFGLDDLIVAGVGFVVGFVTGVIVGVAEGRSLGDTLLLGLEAGLLGAAGAWLAYATVGLATLALGGLGLGIGSGLATGLAIGAAVVGGLNGVISGATEIYAWDSWTGWAAFLSDSTWGIVGTGIGVLVHTVNLFYFGDRKYQRGLSKRQNRHVYDGGFGFGNFAFTQGNVISNLDGRHGSLLDHESSHILQNRIFGPVFTATYVGWMVAGAVVGFVIGVGLWIAGEQGIGQSIEDMAYTNNPWESWAYSVGGSHSGGVLAWS